MPATAAQIEKAAYKFTGVVAGAGTCDACSRECTQRVFTVEHRETGVKLDLGRRCAAKATGYPTTAIEREAARAARLAEVDRREAICAAAYPALAAIDAAGDFMADGYGLIRVAATEDMFWEGGYREGQWRGYLDQHSTH
jgi:hypothetical protein